MQQLVPVEGGFNATQMYAGINEEERAKLTAEATPQPDLHTAEHSISAPHAKKVDEPSQEPSNIELPAPEPEDRSVVNKGHRVQQEDGSAAKPVPHPKKRKGRRKAKPHRTAPHSHAARYS